MIRYLTALIALLFSCAVGMAAEALPDAPKGYFNDYAQVTSPTTASRLNSQLADFERATGNQLLIVVYPKMPSDSSIEDFTQRAAQHWGAGQKQRNNGVVLFVFIQNRTMYIQVGYGLEGALPDALCKQIIENELKPRFRARDFDGGLVAGAQAIMAATKGEYKGSGKTVAESRQKRGVNPILIVIILFILLPLLGLTRSVRRNGFIISSGGFGGGPFGSFGGGGGFSGGGGGGFSGGGGSFGGGGAGGSW